MDEIYKLVEQGKKRQGIDSDRGYALANGIKYQVIIDLKAGKSMPNGENMLKILLAAGAGVTDGLNAIQRQKEAGYALFEVMAGTAGLAGLSLFTVTGHVEAAAGLGLALGVVRFIHYAKL